MLGKDLLIGCVNHGQRDARKRVEGVNAIMAQNLQALDPMPHDEPTGAHRRSPRRARLPKGHKKPDVQRATGFLTPRANPDK